MPNRSPEEYLALAQHAENAAKSLEGIEGMVVRDCWHSIAEAYRELAAIKLRQMQERRDVPHDGISGFRATVKDNS
jgi:hypothetical protein